MKNLTRQNPGQLFVAQELINKVKSKCCGIKVDEYIKYAVEVGEVSLRTEPGVLTMYAVKDKENPCLVTILETYSSKDAYEKHIASAHFQKYKKGTLHMVKSLQLCDQTPLNPANKIYNYIDYQLCE